LCPRRDFGRLLEMRGTGFTGNSSGRFLLESLESFKEIVEVILKQTKATHEGTIRPPYPKARRKKRQNDDTNRRRAGFKEKANHRRSSPTLEELR